MALKEPLVPMVSLLPISGSSHTNWVSWTDAVRRETPLADCRGAITPSSKAELPVVPSQKVASQEMSSKCAWTATEKTLNNMQTTLRCGWNLAWRQAYVTFPRIPAWCRVVLFQLKKGVWWVQGAAQWNTSWSPPKSHLSELIGNRH